MSVGYSCPLASNYWYPLPFSTADWDQHTNCTFSSTHIDFVTSQMFLNSGKTGTKTTGTVLSMRFSFVLSGSTGDGSPYVGYCDTPSDLTNGIDCIRCFNNGNGQRRIDILNGGAVTSGSYQLVVGTTYVVDVTITSASATTNAIAYTLYAADGVTVLETGGHTATNGRSNTISYVMVYGNSVSSAVSITNVWLYGPNIVGNACLGIVPSTSNILPASTAKITHASLYKGTRGAAGVQAFHNKFKDAV